MSSYPLSVGQKALWFLHALAPDSSAYNLAIGFRVLGAVDPDRLRRALVDIATRHDMLRSTFTEIDGQPRRIVLDGDRVDLRTDDLPGATAAELHAAAERWIARPFRLVDQPPVRLVLIRTAPEESVLLFVGHHIVVDAASLVVVTRDLLHAYQRPNPESPIPQSYQDYVRTEEQLLDSAELAELESHWRGVCAGAPTALNLPTDRPRPAVQRPVGSSYRFALPDRTVQRLRASTRAAAVTPFALLITAFQALLYRHSGQTDFLLGLTATTRGRAFRNSVGYFVNPLVYRARCRPDTTFSTLLGEAAGQLRSGMDHQRYPFALLPAALDVPRDASRSPLFQVLVAPVVASRLDPLMDLAIEGDPERELDYAGFRLTAFDLPPQQEGQFDLTLELLQSSRSLVVVLKYNTDLFDQSTVERLGSHYLALVESALDSPDTPLDQLAMLDDTEREMLLSLAGADTGLPDW